jgi:hypothetical protein
MEKQSEAHQSAAVKAAGGNEGVTKSKVRNVAFKGLVILFSLLLIALFNLVFLMIVVSWLPDATYLAILGDLEAADLVHRVHDSILPIIAWSVLVGTVVQLRRPEVRLAPLLMALAVPVTVSFVELATGTYTFMGTGPALVSLVLIALLHPRARELVRIPRLNGVMAGLTVAAATVWIPFAYRQAQLQRVAGDVHAQMEHWNRMAAFALYLIVWALIASSDTRGWRLTAWFAGLASAWYGLQSLLFPAASAAALPWAIAAVAWGVVYIFVAERRARTAQPEQQNELAAQPG